ISDAHEIVVIDPQTLKVTKTIPTPELKDNHPLQYDPAFHALYVVGENGMLSVYSPTGKRLHEMRYPTRVDQCDLDVTRSLLACGRGKITLVKLGASAKPTIVAQIDVAPGMKTLAVDQKTGDIWVVWSDNRAHGAAFVQRFTYRK
ncbi:MAG: hypothetical protein JOZ86_05485, partial [Candidatus Eremiobacteraeota bacterium]|nr:hypothetical protein [Candidatus Eremiobacteraeota bacterium]